MEEFEKWLNEQKNSVAWSLLGEESRLYQAWVCGAMNQALLTSKAAELNAPSSLPRSLKCANCFTHRSLLPGGILEKCPNCGDDETDLTADVDIP